MPPIKLTKPALGPAFQTKPAPRPPSAPKNPALEAIANVNRIYANNPNALHTASANSGDTEAIYIEILQKLLALP